MRQKIPVGHINIATLFSFTLFSMSQIVGGFLHGTLVLSFHIDLVLPLSSRRIT